MELLLSILVCFVPALFLAGGTALALLTAELLRRRESPPLGETRALN